MSAATVPELEPTDEHSEADIARAMRKVAWDATDCLRRLYLPKGDPNRHPDADVTWAECSMQTRAALAIGKAYHDNPDADLKQVFGIIIVQGRSKSALEWEAQALEIDAKQRARAIEAMATEKEPSK